MRPCAPPHLFFSFSLCLFIAVYHSAHNIICVLVFGAGRDPKEEFFTGGGEGTIVLVYDCTRGHGSFFCPLILHTPFSAIVVFRETRSVPLLIHSPPSILPLLRSARMRMRANRSREKSPFEVLQVARQAARNPCASAARPISSTLIPLLLVRQSTLLLGLSSWFGRRRNSRRENRVAIFVSTSSFFSIYRRSGFRSERNVHFSTKRA